MKTYLGIELGSTRIKAVAIDEKSNIVSKGEYGWKSSYVDGIWTYSLDEAWQGLKTALKTVDTTEISAVGISGMMHGFLAFDKDWKLLTPFRTWQNTTTEQAAKILSYKFKFNIPQRWSIAHLYQAILNKEVYIDRVEHITTLAGYIHFMLTGKNVLGIGEASGMFPIDSDTKTYSKNMVAIFNKLLSEQGINKNILDLLPKVKVAGEIAGRLVNADAIDNILPENIPFAPPEGDMQTGMIATNSVAIGTGNISAGTAFNLTIVTGSSLQKVYPEIDIITTPTGVPAVLIHTNNGTNDINAWFGILGEVAKLYCGHNDDIYQKLYELSLTGDSDCGGVVVYNYMAGEPIAHVYDGRPLVIRTPDANFTLANFVKAQLYSPMATMRMGIDLLSDENIKINKIMGHGGFFKTPVVGQQYMAAACNAPICCNSSASEGGPYGMALLAAYTTVSESITLNDYLEAIPANRIGVTIAPAQADIDGFNSYMRNFKAGLEAEHHTQGVQLCSKI